MPFRIKINDLIIECDSQSELEQAISILRRFNREHLKKLPQPNKAIWNKEVGIKFWGNLAGNPKKLVEFLLEDEGGKTTQEIRATLGYEDSKKLAGVITSLSKNLKRLGLKIEQFMIKETTRRGREKIVRYKLNPEVLHVLKEIASAK